MAASRTASAFKSLTEIANRLKSFDSPVPNIEPDRALLAFFSSSFVRSERFCWGDRSFIRSIAYHLSFLIDLNIFFDGVALFIYQVLEQGVHLIIRKLIYFC